MSIKLPSVFAVQRGVVVTDGLMSSLRLKPRPEPKSEQAAARKGAPDEVAERETVTREIRVIRHGIRGTNINPKPGTDSVALPARVESAKSCHDAIGLEVSFSFRTIPANTLPFACSEPEYKKAIQGFIERYFVPGVREFDEVCLRYARNILNGRWLWRNRILGDVSVTATTRNGTVYTSKGSSLHGFGDYTEDERKLAENVIATGLLGHGASPAVRVTGRVDFGFEGEVEVFPSQNMVTNKPDGFGRSLYKVDMIPRRELMAILGTEKGGGIDAGNYHADMIDMGRAALRDQKIGNAIRTIDTWYMGADEASGPIPVEPNGASLDRNAVLRSAKGYSAESLLQEIDEMHPGDAFDERAAFLIALLVRGGVFSGKSDKAEKDGEGGAKKKPGKKSAKQTSADVVEEIESLAADGPVRGVLADAGAQGEEPARGHGQDHGQGGA